VATNVRLCSRGVRVAGKARSKSVTTNNCESRATQPYDTAFATVGTRLMSLKSENGTINGAPAIETRLFINNGFVLATSNRTFPVINPASGKVTAHVHEAVEADVELAVEAAEKAFPTWSELGGFQRAAYFYKLADLYEQRNGELAKLEAQSMGRPVGTYSAPCSTRTLIHERLTNWYRGRLGFSKFSQIHGRQSH